MSSTTRAPGVWLFRPESDLLWGSGLAYLVLFVLMLAKIELVMAYAPQWIVLFLLVLVSVPHYGATILRAYERKEDRDSYRLFTIYSTIALGCAFVWGVRDVWIGSLLFTLYLTWSPWHYTAQNYGISLMILRRQGIEIDDRTRRLLRFSLTLPLVIALLYMHSGALRAPFVAGDRVQFIALGVPAIAADIMMFSATLLYAVSIALFVAAIVKKGKGLRPASPAFAILLVQGVWLALPSIFRNWFPISGPQVLRTNYAVYTFTWVALAHAAQYLWITAYYSQRTGRTRSTASFYWKAILCGCVLWALPALFFAPGVLGRLPYDMGLAAVTAAAINLHHFILDGAVWKLRDPRVGGVLSHREARAATPPVIAASPTPAPLALARPAAALGLVCLAILLFGTGEEQWLYNRLNNGDALGATRSLERLAWVGRDSADARVAIGAIHMKDGNAANAERQLAIGVGIFPTASGFIRLGEARASQGKSEGSMEAFATAVELEPENRMAKMLLALAHTDVGQMDEAQALLDACGRREEDTDYLRVLRERLEGRVARGSPPKYP